MRPGYDVSSVLTEEASPLAGRTPLDITGGQNQSRKARKMSMNKTDSPKARATIRGNGVGAQLRRARETEHPRHRHEREAKGGTLRKSRVWSCNEWDQLEEVIVGNPLRARFPTPDPSTQLAEFHDRSLAEIPRGPFPQQIIEETEEDLNEFIRILEGLGVTVKRPETWSHEAKFSTIHWEAQGYYNYCPRDILLVIGDQIIETPNVIRSRAQETFSYRELLIDYMKSGAKWYSAPKPMLLDSLFDYDLKKPTPRNDEPAFDAANVLRLGRDLIYLVSATGNELGGHWLQSILGDTFRVHFLKDVYYGSHIDFDLCGLAAWPDPLQPWSCQ